MKGTNDASKLASQYRSWNTEDLIRVTTLESEEYTPEAISFMLEELHRRGVTPEAQEAIEGRAVEDAHREQRSLAGIRGWLLAFIVLAALNFGAALISGIFGLAQILPAFVQLIFAFDIIVGFYGLGTLWLLVSRHPRAPQHAKVAVVVFCFLAIGSWLIFHWVGLAPGRFPIGAVSFACVWWSYLSYSKRVQFTYTPRPQVTAEPQVAQ